MIEKSVSVFSSFDARPAAMFVQTASRFSSSIKVKIDNKIVNAKSIMGIISLGILNGQVITLIAEGEDESQAVNELQNFLTTV